MTAFAFIKLRDGDTVKILASDVEDVRQDYEAAVKNGHATFDVEDYAGTHYTLPVSEYKFTYSPDGGNRR